jgi:hypothetical protein
LQTQLNEDSIYSFTHAATNLRISSNMLSLAYQIIWELILDISAVTTQIPYSIQPWLKNSSNETQFDFDTCIICHNLLYYLLL